MTTTRQMSSLLSLSAFGLVTFASAFAFAQQQPQQGCPPGSWFCADAQVQPAPAGQPVAPSQLQPLPPQGQERQTPSVVYQQAPAAPPVVVYQPAPPVVLVRPQPRYYYYRPVRKMLPYRQSEWGVNLRFDGAVFGGVHGNGNGGMGGVGAGLRYKPTPYLGIEGGIDFLAGRDYNDNSRNETGLSLTGLLFLNPRSRVQVYLLGGINWSIANVTPNSYNYPYESASQMSGDTYHYFGGQFGAGLEFRLSRYVALNFDVRGLIRSRTDASAASNPEFVDASGHTTNTSGGALLTGGMTFYF